MAAVTFDEIAIGDKRSYTRTVTREDIERFAEATGDTQRLHLSEEFAKTTQFGGIIAHGMLTASYISTVLGTIYPGEGSVYLGMDKIRFLAPVRPGDTITAAVEVTEKHPSKPVVKFACACVNQNGETVLTAEAVVKAPIRRPATPTARPLNSPENILT